MARRLSRTTRQALAHFFRTTTLHGFKYLYSEYRIDRIGWAWCCGASSCCAGVLCAVLWARLLQVPALLAVRDLPPGAALAQHTPLVAVCPPAQPAAALFLARLGSLNASMIRRLSTTVSRFLDEKPAADDQLELLDQLLKSKNISLTEMMFEYTPSCQELTVKCRWQSVIVPCEHMFDKKLTNWGICCIMKPDRSYYRLLNESIRPSARFETTRKLDLALQCSNVSIFGCEFFTKFDGEENVERMVLVPGFNYFAQIRFTSVHQNSAEEVLQSSCISDKGYSRALCLDKCAEQSCGCTDPLRDVHIHEKDYLPPCAVTQMRCLRDYEYHDNVTCNCLPSCNKVTTYTSLESSVMNLGTFVIDPIYDGLDATTSSVVHIRVNIALSQIFTLNPTETWLTLLSSLGGVFNMFLGVGLFSALEILFLLFVKLPIALQKSDELPHPSAASIK